MPHLIKSNGERMRKRESSIKFFPFRLSSAETQTTKLLFHARPTEQTAKNHSKMYNAHDRQGVNALDTSLFHGTRTKRTFALSSYAHRHKTQFFFLVQMELVVLVMDFFYFIFQFSHNSVCTSLISSLFSSFSFLLHISVLLLFFIDFHVFFIHIIDSI